MANNTTESEADIYDAIGDVFFALNIISMPFYASVIVWCGVEWSAFSTRLLAACISGGRS